ncbi:TPA: hypothetical protein DD425_02560 [Candidatus Saccharibacteria bacterium]|nr:hypothetical protein [Candidatus Saccharibacteria bacterium]|tara:strand:- start:11962 stop:14178 length:2217 start_codon:yes stop_codon:yes gene_type:complete
MKNRQKVYYDVLDGRDELTRLYDRDEERFRGSYFSDKLHGNQHQLAAQLVFSAHALEKSLSNDGFEVGHGFSVAKALVGYLDSYKKHDYDISHPAYTNTLSVLSALYKVHENTPYKQDLELIFGEWKSEIRGCESDIGGADTIFSKDKEDNKNKNFRDLSGGRYAVRTYSKKKVRKSDIEDVVGIAMKTPTVCNRQSIRVRVMYDQGVIARVLGVQGGIAYYDTPPVLLLITADDNGYVDINERNQGYIDGGLFAMSVLYALEYKGLAACPLHAMFETGRDLTVRGMLDIPENEKLITFISVGHFKKESHVPKSFRYAPSDIIMYTDKIHDFRIETVTPGVENVNVGFVSKIRSKLKIRTRITWRLRNLKRVVRVRTRYRDFKKYIGAKYLNKYRYGKIDGAILTLTGYFNYGNMLQRYALQKFLSKNHYKFISYEHDLPKPNDPRDPRFVNTADFVDKYIFRKTYNRYDNYSTYIVGSDQVWRNFAYEDDLRDLGFFFFNFLEDDNRSIKRISYAASFGQNKLDDAGIGERFISYAKRLLVKFNSISVRESSARGIMRQTWGVDAEQVVDPTLLLGAEEYSDLINRYPGVLSKPKKGSAYILISNDAKKHIIAKIEDFLGGDIDILNLETEKVLPPVEQWLKSFRDSKIIVTDSFHGMLFSVINNTDFIITESGPGGMARIEDFLGQLGLVDRLIRDVDADSFDPQLLGSIDWQDVNERLGIMRQQSADWLLGALKK